MLLYFPTLLVLAGLSSHRLLHLKQGEQLTAPAIPVNNQKEQRPQQHC